MLSKRVERLGKRVADAGKDSIVSKAAELCRGVARKVTDTATQAATNAAKSADAAVKTTAKKVSETASEYVVTGRVSAIKATDDAAVSAKKAISETESVIKNYASSKGNQVRTIAEDSTRMTMTYAAGVAASAKDSTAKSFTSAGRSAVAAATTAKEATASAADTVARESFLFAEEKKKRVVRWLWWWGLAAVGVYGLATSIPREMRLALESGYKKDESGELKAKNDNKEKLDSEVDKGSEGGHQYYPDIFKTITSFIWR